MRLFPVTDYGAYSDTAANHDDLINGAYNAAVAHGAGYVYFPYLGTGKEYRHTELWIQHDNIGLKGEFNGSDVFNPRLDAQGKRIGCVLKYVGAGGNAIRIEPPSSKDWPLTGIAVRDLQIDGNGLAGNGIKIGAVRGGSFKRLHIQGATGAQFHTTATPIQTAIRSGAYRNYGEQIWARAAGTAIPFLFAGDWTQDNAGGRHTAFLTLVDPHATHENAAAYCFHACDDVVLVNAAASRITGGTGLFAYFHGSNEGNRSAEGNFIFGGNGQGNIKAVGGTRPSRSNTLFITSVDTQPVVDKDTGATIYVYDTGGQSGNNAYFKHPPLIQA